MLQNGDDDAQIELRPGKGVLQKDLVLVRSAPGGSFKSSIMTGLVRGTGQGLLPVTKEAGNVGTTRVILVLDSDLNGAVWLVDCLDPVR